MTKATKHARSRMHQRIRELAPLLPRLIKRTAGRVLAATDHILSLINDIDPDTERGIEQGVCIDR